MKKTTKIAFMVLVASMTGVLGQQLVHGEEIDIGGGLILNDQQVIFIIIIGAVAGLTRAFLGYEKSPNDFDRLLFAKTVIQMVLIAIPAALAYVLALPELNAVGYVFAFFTIAGISDFVRTGQKKTIPSNATEDEINRILNGGD